MLKKLAEHGLSVVAITSNLVRKYGFSSGYDSVKRYLNRIRKKNSPTVILDFKPGESAQVDFGTGFTLTDLKTGEVFKTGFWL